MAFRKISPTDKAKRDQSLVDLRLAYDIKVSAAENMRSQVRNALMAGATWLQVAKATGMSSRQAAQFKFADIFPPWQSEKKVE